MAEPKEKHWRFVKQLLKYIKSTRDYSLVYPQLNSTTAIGYSDADHAGDYKDRKSTSGYVFILGGCTISWKSQKQKTVSLSSTEAEYVALSQSTQEEIWISELITELGYTQRQVTLCNDNLSAMQSIKNSTSHNLCKHIDVRYHFIRDHYSRGTINLEYIPTDKLVADILTKGVPKNKHNIFMKMLILIN